MRNKVDVTWDKLKKLGLVRKHGKRLGWGHAMLTQYDQIFNGMFVVSHCFQEVSIHTTEVDAIRHCKSLVIESYKTRYM